MYCDPFNACPGIFSLVRMIKCFMSAMVCFSIFSRDNNALIPSCILIDDATELT